MSGCEVCVDYPDDVNLRIDQAGLAHHGAMQAIRRMESTNSPGRAVVMGPTFSLSGVLVREAELTADALGFSTT